MSSIVIELGTKREVFDQVREHLLGQMKKSKNDQTNVCMYRYGDLKCAIGALIPDNVYDPNFERSSVYQLFNESKLDFRISDVYKHSQVSLFLNNLQRIHDAFEPDSWENQLLKFERIWFGTRMVWRRN